MKSTIEIGSVGKKLTATIQKQQELSSNWKKQSDKMVARVHGNEQRIGSLSKNITDQIALLESQAMRNITRLSETLSSTIADVSTKVTSVTTSTNSLSSEAGLQN